jgi:osmotically-inducible protein OsmY
MTQTIRKSNKDLQATVTDELAYNPSLDATHLVVLADDGAVTLSGDVDSLPERHAAKRAAMRVAGVKAVTDDMVVRGPSSSGTSDSDIAEAANQILNWTVDVPADSVKAGVHGRTLTLSGAVTWQYQREAAARAVMYLKGVTGVTNAIALSATAPVSGVKAEIEAAVLRNAQLDSHQIKVDVDGADVKLRGAVRSWAERRQAEYLAWSASGVTGVENHLAVNG